MNTEIKKEAEMYAKAYNGFVSKSSIYYAFIAGAQWQAEQPIKSVEEDAVWDLLKYLKQHHYLPQTESTLQEITKQYLQQLKQK